MFRIANKRNCNALGIESGLKLAFASPVLDLGFGRGLSFSDAVRDAAARLQSALLVVADRLKALADRFTVGRAAQVASAGVVSPQRSEQLMRLPMTLTDQWSKVSAVLVRSVDGARLATEMQSAATQQLDLAQYGLLTLVDELSAVMTIPGRRSRSATVHTFNGTLEYGDKLRAAGHALAA